MAAKDNIPKTVTVYALIASDEDGRVRYVGQTVLGARRRLQMHMYGARHKQRTPVQKWMMAVVARGARVDVIILDGDAVLHETERQTIAEHRERGVKLLNLTEGGEGTVGHRFKGKPKPWLAERNRQNKGKPGRPRYPGETEALMAYVRGAKRPWVSERNRQGKGKPGHPHTEASRAKIAAGNTGKVKSEETKAKIAAAKRGKKPPAETLARMSVAQRARYAKVKEAIDD